MQGRTTFLPIMLVVVVVVLAYVAISSGRSNDPGVAGSRDYPHHVCTINDYCEGDSCSRDPLSFVVYLEHVNGQPRLELDRFNTAATMTRTEDALIFDSKGGEIQGRLTVYNDGGIDLTAFSGDQTDPVEHYASGRCERLKGGNG